MPTRPAATIRRLFSDQAELPIAIAAGATLALGYLLWKIVIETSVPWLHNTGHVLVWISLALGSIHGGKAAWESIRHFKPDIDVLMVVGAGLAAGIGHPEEGALLLFMFTLAGALEHRALARTKDAVSRLNKLMPRAAMVRTSDAGGSGAAQWREVEPELLKSGDVVLVRPGETVPADGIIIDGRSDIDQSTLTGESLPRSVNVGDEVFAGTMNQQGALEVRVSRPMKESSLQRILQLVLEAQETRQPLQRMIDRFSTPYAVSVMCIAIATFLVFLFIRHMPAADAAYRAITLLVVASPCALVIATPTATLCGLSRAARSGVLIKGGDALERLAGITRVALDKTGTLTTGKIEVTHVEAVAGSDVESLLSLAFAAEERSTHPIAAAIVRMAKEHHLAPARIASLTNVPGHGIEGTFPGANGAMSPVRIGNLEFCEPIIPVCFRRHTSQLVTHIQTSGGKPIVIAHDGQAMVLSLADTPREGAKQLTRDLHEAGVQSVTMLTGDSLVIAERLAKELGIENVHAGLLPEDKVEHIRRIRAEGVTESPADSAPRDLRDDSTTTAPSQPSHDWMPAWAQGGGHKSGGLAVIGDGVNDAPALAVADVGLAMGGIGADAALETADVVLLHDDLNRIPWSFSLARRVKRIMLANLVFATAVIAVLAVFTLLGWVPLPVGVIGHEGSTLLVVANSLRLLGHPDPKRTDRRDHA